MSSTENNLFLEIEKLKEHLVIVEGKKDIRALYKFGITNIIEIKGPLEIFSEEIAKENKEVILLTDLDPAGRKLFAKLNHYFSQLGVKVNKDFRNFLYKNTKLTQIEGIDNYVKKN